MSTKSKKPNPAAIQKPERTPKLTAGLAVSPTVRGAVIGGEYATKLFGNIDQQEYFDRLVAGAKAIQDGDLSKPKAMLAAQANTLDLLFNSLVRRSAKAEYVNQMETYMRLALKAQAQAAHTLKVLGELVHPRQVAFVKQANIAHGHQQVNNGSSASSRAHAKPGNRSNELLEQGHGEWLDTGAAGQAGRGDTTLETVGQVNRAQN